MGNETNSTTVGAIFSSTSAIVVYCLLASIATIYGVLLVAFTIIRYKAKKLVRINFYQFLILIMNSVWLLAQVVNGILITNAEIDFMSKSHLRCFLLYELSLLFDCFYLLVYPTYFKFGQN